MIEMYLKWLSCELQQLNDVISPSNLFYRTTVDNYMVMIPYGDKWRLQRRIIHQEFNKSASSVSEKLDIQVKHAQYVSLDTSVRNCILMLILSTAFYWVFFYEIPYHSSNTQFTSLLVLLWKWVINKRISTSSNFRRQCTVSRSNPPTILS
jgi:hypothetical protein